MGKGRDRLHLNGIAFLKRMIKDSWRVDDLPPKIAIVTVTNIKGLRRKRVRLDV